MFKINGFTRDLSLTRDYLVKESHWLRWPMGTQWYDMSPECLWILLHLSWFSAFIFTVELWCYQVKICPQTGKQTPPKLLCGISCCNKQYQLSCYVWKKCFWENWCNSLGAACALVICYGNVDHVSGIPSQTLKSRVLSVELLPV